MSTRNNKPVLNLIRTCPLYTRDSDKEVFRKRLALVYWISCGKWDIYILCTLMFLHLYIVWTSYCHLAPNHRLNYNWINVSFMPGSKLQLVLLETQHFSFKKKNVWKGCRQNVAFLSLSQCVTKLPHVIAGRVKCHPTWLMSHMCKCVMFVVVFVSGIVGYTKNLYYYDNICWLPFIDGFISVVYRNQICKYIILWLPKHDLNPNPFLHTWSIWKFISNRHIMLHLLIFLAGL